MRYPFINVADDHIIIAYELVARVQISGRSHGKILSCYTASRYSFIYARTSGQIDSIVIKTEAFAPLLSPEHLKCEFFIFLIKLRQILFVKSIRNIRI